MTPIYLKETFLGLILSLLFSLFQVNTLAAEEWIDIRHPMKPPQLTEGVKASVQQTIPELKLLTSSDSPGKKSASLSYALTHVMKSTLDLAEGKFDTLFIPENGYHFGVGQPNIPTKSVFFEIPAGYTPKVIVKSGPRTELSGVNMMPVQPPPTDSLDASNMEFIQDVSLYNSDRFFPNDNFVSVNKLKIRNKRVLEVVFTSMLYNPAKKTIHFSPDLIIDIKLQHNNSKGPLAQHELLPSLSVADSFKGFSLFSETVKKSAEKTVQMEKYLILMNKQFSTNTTLQEFIQWKREKGYKVKTVTTDKIAREINVNQNLHDKCVQYLRDLPPKDYPNYLLIIGDEKEETGVPGNYFETIAGRGGGYSSLEYSLRDATDYLPDLLMGRLPASTNKELSQILRKIIFMDKEPPLSSPMYDKILVAGQIQNKNHWRAGTPDDKHADRLFMETGDAVANYFENHSGHNYLVKRALINPHNMKEGYFWNKGDSPMGPGLLWANTSLISKRTHQSFLNPEILKQTIVDAVNGGTAIVQYRAHGNYTSWAYETKPGEFRYYLKSSDIMKLKNVGNLPFIFSTTCQTGGYHTKGNFAKSWLISPDGGAYGVIAAVDYSSSWLNDYIVHGIYESLTGDYISQTNSSTSPKYDTKLPEATLDWKSDATITDGQSKRTGEILRSSLLYLYTHLNIEGSTKLHFQLYNIFGDPESYIRLHQPKTFKSPELISTIEISEKSVDLIVSNIEKGTRVSLYSSTKGLNIHQAQIASGNTVTFKIIPTQEGAVTVTLTKYDRVPLQKSIKIVASKENSKPPKTLEESRGNFELDSDSPPDPSAKQEQGDGWKSVF